MQFEEGVRRARRIVRRGWMEEWAKESERRKKGEEMMGVFVCLVSVMRDTTTHRVKKLKLIDRPLLTIRQ